MHKRAACAASRRHRQLDENLLNAECLVWGLILEIRVIVIDVARRVNAAHPEVSMQMHIPSTARVLCVAVQHCEV